MKPDQHDVVFRLDVAYEDERRGFPVYRAMTKAAADLGVKAEVEFSSALVDNRAFCRCCCECNQRLILRLEEWGNPLSRARDIGIEMPWPPEIDGMFRLAGWASKDGSDLRWLCNRCRGTEELHRLQGRQ